LSKLVLGILASGSARDLQAIIDRIEAGKLDAEIACVISNKPDAFVLERAKKHGIEAIFLDKNNAETREEYDQRLANLLNEKGVELALLIGYNKFLTKPFLDSFKNRAMNIHPSLLPAFKGWDKNVHQGVLDSGAKVSGCTLFFVNENPDGGPIIAQKKVLVADGETVQSLKQKVQSAEQEVLLNAIGLFAEGKLKVEGERVKILG